MYIHFNERFQERNSLFDAFNVGECLDESYRDHEEESEEEESHGDN